jgi:hypothetical protein
MSIRTSHKGHRIQFTGADANMFMAYTAVDALGADALKNVSKDGPAYKAILAVMKERGITPNKDEVAPAKEPEAG